jgi:hypothetical protein
MTIQIDPIEMHNRIGRAAEEAATAYMASLAPGLPDIAWSYRAATSYHGVEVDGYIPEHEYDDPAAVAEQWRAALGLNADLVDQGDGSTQCLGTSSGLEVRLWFIHDRARWEQSIADMRARRAGRDSAA